MGLVDTAASDRIAIKRTAGRRAGSALRVHDAFRTRPVLTLPEVCARTELSFPAAASAMRVLAAHGIARELTGRAPNRLFAYDSYLSILSGGIEA